MATAPTIMKPPVTDRAHDVLRDTAHPLDCIFAPKAVAVIGATENPSAVGRTVLWNLISSPFGGTVYPVNPKRPSVLGIKAYPSIKSIPEKVDLVVVCTPANTVPGIIREAVECGVKGAVVISAGFKELGGPGIKLETELLAEARKGGMRLIGPNCLGVMSPLSGLNATFAAGMAKPGNVAFLSQSGALGTAVLDWSFQEMVGFSAFVSIGSMLDVDWGDLIDYLGNDARTQSIVIYMESIGNARSFLSAAREVALTKPIIVIKAGRTEAAAKAAASHTGSLTGSDEVLDAAFRRVGVLRVNSIADVFNMAEILAKQPRPKGPRLTIVTNAGGPGVLATDALIQNGGELTAISESTFKALNDFLPPHWSRGNPVDVLGDAPADRYAKALEICARDPNSDGLLVILTPQSMTEPTQTAELLRNYSRIEDKPVLASWMGGPIVKAGEDILTRAGIPTFPNPDEACKAFTYMWRWSYNLRGLYETPEAQSASEEGINRAAAEKLVANVRNSGRNLMTEFESKELLAAYGIPTVTTIIAKTEAEAVAAAKKIGFPVVLKLFSETITHKTDVGGVQLNLHDADDVARAYKAIQKSVTEKAGAEHFQGVTVQKMIRLEGYEIILGASPDAQFGPVLLFGTGGQLVEVFKDRALALPPLNATLARRMMEQTKIFTALKGVRGRKPVDLGAMEQIMVRFSQLVAEQRWVKEIDINPLLASASQIVALDARVVLYEKDTPLDKLPKPAVRAYPVQYVVKRKLKDGTDIIIRPIRPEDEPLMVKFHQTLSERSVRLRYFQPLKLGARVAHERLIRVCFNDYDREMAMVAELPRKNAESEILGIGRLSKDRFTSHAEFAMLVSDAWQNKGIGTQMLSLLVQAAKDEQLKGIKASIMAENIEMQHVCQKVGFDLRRLIDEPTVLADLAL